MGTRSNATLNVHVFLLGLVVVTPARPTGRLPLLGWAK